MQAINVAILEFNDGYSLAFPCPDLVAIKEDWGNHGLALETNEDENASEWRLRALIGRGVPLLSARTFQQDGRFVHSMPCQHHLHLASRIVYDHESGSAALECLKMTLAGWLRARGYDAAFGPLQRFTPSMAPPSGGPPLLP